MFTFGRVQGPVECANRLTIFCQQNESVKTLAMLGVAGGIKLGEVAVGWKAFAPEHGRTELDKKTKKYQRQFEPEVSLIKAERRPKIWEDLIDEFVEDSESFPFGVHTDICFVSYNAVRPYSSSKLITTFRSVRNVRWY